MFQFLIGRLKTFTELTKYIHDKKFQFLIGRLKTNFKPSNQCISAGFQFLIGRLKTGTFDSISRTVSLVSIPYR